MIRNLRIFEIVIMCLLVKMMYSKSLRHSQVQANVQKDERVKRGYSHYGGNDFGSSVHVSSGVLQYGAGDEHSISSDSNLSIGHSGSADAGFDLSSLSADHSSGVDSSSHLGSSVGQADVWAASGLSPGYEVWLEPLPDEHATSGLDSASIHTSSTSGIHPGSDHIANTVFSDDLGHSAQIQLPSSQLHTKIASSSIGSSIHDHGASAISDNIDFNNIADIRKSHYSKSYGK